MEARTIDSRYRLITEIGRGPMASVYEAIDLQRGQQVVVKLFQSRFQSDPNFAIRFREHLRVLVELEHDNLATILDYGLADEGYYLVTEAPHGITLRTFIAEQGALSPSQALYASKQICAGLSVVHERGLVHRDLKPENILLLPDSRVKVTDIGLTSLLSETGLSKTDVMLNGVGYMSPEQARGKPVGPESDIYSIGILIFEMLTERLPFESSDTWRVVKMHAQDNPPSVHDINPKVPIGLSRIVDQALQKERSSRFASASEMETALAELPQSEGFWWHKAPLQSDSREGLGTFLISLPSYRQQASIRFRQLGSTIVASLKRNPLSRRVLVIHYLASFLIAFVILFFVSGLLIGGNSQAANDDASYQSMIEAHRRNDQRDHLPETSVRALIPAVTQPLNNSQENVAVDPAINLNGEAVNVSSAGLTGGGGTQINSQNGGEDNGKAKGKDNQGNNGSDNGKKKGHDKNGIGKNNGRGNSNGQGNNGKGKKNK